VLLEGGEQGGMQVAWTSMQSELGGCVFVTPPRRSGPGMTWKRTPAWLTPYGAGSGDVFKWDGLASQCSKVALMLGCAVEQY
jgi:hypothetical protein